MSITNLLVVALLFAILSDTSYLTGNNFGSLVASVAGIVAVVAGLIQMIRLKGRSS